MTLMQLYFHPVPNLVLIIKVLTLCSTQWVRNGGIGMVLGLGCTTGKSLSVYFYEVDRLRGRCSQSKEMV